VSTDSQAFFNSGAAVAVILNDEQPDGRGTISGKNVQRVGFLPLLMIVNEPKCKQSNKKNTAGNASYQHTGGLLVQLIIFSRTVFSKGQKIVSG